MNSSLARRGHLRIRGLALSAVAAAACLAMSSPSALAVELDTGNPELTLRWDTTVKYSTAFRLKNPSQSIVGGINYNPTGGAYFPNTDDGDRNFKRGMISNRLDVLTEMDLLFRNWGARVSAAGWYDTVYQRDRNANDSPSTSNPVSVAHNQFTGATRELHGGDAEILDAFVFGKFKLGEMPATVRLGKHTLLYGESLMFGANGIAAAQAPIDVVKALSAPSSQFKELMMPVNQVSGQLQVNTSVMVGGYYMLDWKPDRLPGSGSYFSGMDAVGAGGERLIIGYSPAGNVSFYRGPDLKAKKSGQGGMQLRMHVGEVDYGLYAVRWNDHGASGPVLGPFATGPVASANGLQVGTYRWFFHEGIRAVGGSFSTTLDTTVPLNVSGEMSVRANQPLQSDAKADPLGVSNNSDNPLYAVGKTAHAQVNWIGNLGPALSFISREVDFAGEIAWNRRLSVTKNPASMNVNATRDAANIRFVLEPKYRQVFSGVDLSVPVGVGYGIKGNSSAVGAFLGRHVGDLSIGVNGSYLDVWRFGVNLTHYFGPIGPFITLGHRSFLQSNGDRDFVSLNVRRTF